ncbi:PREDICTED: protamine-3-like [Lipotes vexillifer]|uniref:Protamine-3-like n=1 Tax=Lipotes vexillifer TaxID=118797 RepID=A0A340X966_LIPVE|nr:PREDICTED: protamine-3-like [Lipotes vexillifer]
MEEATRQGEAARVWARHLASVLPLAFPPSPERQPKWATGSHCAKLGTGHGRGHESSMKKLVVCVSQDNFSLSSEGEEEGEPEGEAEELPVQGKLLLLEPEWQEEGAKDDSVVQKNPKPKQTQS